MTHRKIELPPQLHTEQGDTRRIGIEIEFAGLDPATIVSAVQGEIGGDAEAHTAFEYDLKGTALGDFHIELDAEDIKSLGDGVPPAHPDNKEDWTLDQYAVAAVGAIAELVVPWELVSDPIPMDRLQELVPVVDALRAAGARGTRYASRFAFGLHMNPEMPALDAATVTNYLRAYVCLYDWINYEENIDLARRVTPHINHYPNRYLRRIANPDYQPDLDQLIDDYLADNDTRNRSLDMLPLFSHLDDSRVRAVIDDPRIKSRPTLHYRLPNCDIDNPNWNLDRPWSRWLQVERLANAGDRLRACSEAFARHLERWSLTPGGDWRAEVVHFLRPD
jgi:hypothetical protein